MLKILLILANLITSCSSQVNTVRSCLSPYHTLCLISLLISLSPLCPLFKLRGLLPSSSLFFSLFSSLCGVGMKWGLHTSVPTHSARSLTHGLFCLVWRPDMSQCNSGWPQPLDPSASIMSQVQRLEVCAIASSTEIFLRAYSDQIHLCLKLIIVCPLPKGEGSPCYKCKPLHTLWNILSYFVSSPAFFYQNLIPYRRQPHPGSPELLTPIYWQTMYSSLNSCCYDQTMSPKQFG